MKQFILLDDTAIGWDIIGLYIACSIISLVIFYHIIKAAVKSGINESVLGKHYVDIHTTEQVKKEDNDEKMKQLEHNSDL